MNRSTYYSRSAVASMIAIGVLSWSADPAAAEPTDPPAQYSVTSSTQEIKSWQHADWHGHCDPGYYVNGLSGTYAFTPYVWINGASNVTLSESSGEDSFVNPDTGIHYQGLYVKVWNSDLIHDHKASITWQCVPVGSTVTPAAGHENIASDTPFGSS